MYKLVLKLIVYRNIEADSILFKLADIERRVESGDFDKENEASLLLNEVHRLLLLATQYGFDNNLWQGYIAYLLTTTENPYTLCSEKKGAVVGSVNELAMNDFRIFKKLLDYDFSDLEKKLDTDVFGIIRNYSAVKKDTYVYNKNAALKIAELQNSIAKCKDADELFAAVMSFYKSYGVGSFGLNKAFRIADDRLVPIMSTSAVTFADLVGYELQKQELIKNTDSFVKGLPANNVLLYGDAGTGKSSSVKALLNMFYNDGLRIIEVYKHDFRHLSEIVSNIRGRNYRFIIYMDDLSFESAETDYKYLKAVIEGDLEERPENVLIYASSNRRHLIHETFSDRRDVGNDDVHRNDTIAERMSLSARFGVTIGYFKPERREYYEIIKKLTSDEVKIKTGEEKLLAEADKWALRHGGMSGRTAKQFADFINAGGVE